MYKSYKIFTKIYLIATLIFLYLPIIISGIFSFNSSKSRSIFTGFTIDWYIKLSQNTTIHKAFFNSIIIGIIASIISTILGTIITFAIFKSKKNIKKTILSLTNLPLINPEIIQGILLMVLFVSVYKTFGILRPGLTTLVIAHITFCLPNAIINILPKLQEFGETIYEAAIDLGCTPFKAIIKVIIPEIMPTILSTILMTFTISLSDFTISYFTCGNAVTLPILIFSMTRKLVSPEINALSTIMFIVILLITLCTTNTKKEDEQI